MWDRFRHRLADTAQAGKPNRSKLRAPPYPTVPAAAREQGQDRHMPAAIVQPLLDGLKFQVPERYLVVLGFESDIAPP